MSYRCTSLLAALVLLGGSLGAAPEAGARARPRRLKVAVFVQQPPGLSLGKLDKVSRRLKKSLKKNKRIKIARPARILASFSGDLPTDALDEARRKLKLGYSLLDGKLHRKAITAFNMALVAMSKALAYVKKRRLAAAQFGLALAYYHSGLRAQALRMLRRLLTWRPRLRLNLEALPRRFRRLLRSARRWVKRRPRGKLILRTRPEGVMAYLNGHSVGRTPLEIEGVPAGTHYLTLRKRGFVKIAETLDLSPTRRKLEVELALKRSGKYILLEQALKRSWMDFGKRRATSAMQEIKTLLLVDQVVLVRPAAQGSEGVRVDVCLYDLRTGNLLKRMSATLKSPRYGAKALARALYSGVSYDGSLPDPGKEKAPTASGPVPIYKRWWFWVSVGAAVVATTIGIAVPLATRDKGTNIPAGQNPIRISF